MNVLTNKLYILLVNRGINLTSCQNFLECYKNSCYYNLVTKKIKELLRCSNFEILNLLVKDEYEQNFTLVFKGLYYKVTYKPYYDKNENFGIIIINVE
jgi:hypothetical protein